MTTALIWISDRAHLIAHAAAQPFRLAPYLVAGLAAVALAVFFAGEPEVEPAVE